LAKIFPRRFPVDADSSAWAEKTVFDACGQQLSDEWLVLYSQRYIGKRTSLSQSVGLGEVDFILISRRFGVLAIEVKGGRIDIEEGQWFSSNQDGRHKIKNPFVQAEEGARAIFEILRHELPSLRLSKCVNHGVAFPAVSGRSIGNISTYGPREIILFREDLEQLPSRVEQMAAHWRQRPNWSEEDLKSISKILLPTTKSPGVSYEEYLNLLRDLDALTESQQRTMRQLTNQSGKSIVTGGAGTGKTVLGMARAQQLAREGKRVVYLCANRSLAHHLAKEVEAHGNPIAGNLTVDTASSFVSRIGRAGTSKDDFEERKKRIPARIDRFVDAIEVSGLVETLDCLVVDEAQDVSRQDIELVELMVRPEAAGGSVIILGDPNQQLLIGRIESALGTDHQVRSHSLDVNCRNTREIASIAHSFTDFDIATLESISGIKVRNQTLRGSVSEQIRAELFAIREKYDPTNLVVLTLNGFTDIDPEDDLFVDGQRWEDRLTRSKFLDTDRIPVFSARNFQGRESDAVIVALTSKSLLRTFPFRSFLAEAKRNNKIMGRPQVRIDLQRVEKLFNQFRQSGLSRTVEKYRRELDESSDSLTEARREFLVREFQSSREMEFEPRFKDPILDKFWKDRQKKSLKISLYSMMTRAKVVLSIVGDNQALRYIKTELATSEHDIESLLEEI